MKRLPNTLKDILYRLESWARRLAGRTVALSGGQRWSVTTPNLLKSVRHLESGDPLRTAFMRDATQADVFLDIGANFGGWTIPALVGEFAVGHCYAVEPAHGPFGALLRNLQLNGCEDRCTPLPVVVGEAGGFLSFRLDTLDAGTESSHVASGDALTHAPTGALWQAAPIEVSVPSFTVDELLEQDAIREPSLIKIDVEGYEGLVLRGMTRAAAGARRIFLEIHPDRLACGGDADSIGQQMSELGFELAHQANRGRQVHTLWERVAAA